MPTNQDDRQMNLMQELVDLSKERSQMSAERTYMNAERTLSVWIRTAIAAMIFGLAIDRFGLMLYRFPSTIKIHVTQSGIMTHYAGFILVIYSMTIDLFSAIRFRLFCRKYGQQFKVPYYHHAWLPLFYSLMVVLFGVGLLVIMIWLP
jgi:putative membrane protein